VEEAEGATAEGRALTLRLAIDYSARDVMVRAAELAARRGPDGPEPMSRDWYRNLLSEAEGSPPAAGAAGAPDVDLLIRTGGEQRLSDFMLWECAYAELVFTSVLWPDFGESDLAAAMAEYRRRDRRFGRVMEEAV
jgi:undecaprenyl diphosphate synthase